MPRKVDSIFVELRATADRFAADMNTGVRTLLKFENKFKSIGNRLGLALGAGFSVYALKQFGDAIAGLADKGDRLGDITANFERLGGTRTALEQASAATLEMVSSTDLMQIAVGGMVKEIPDFNKNFGLITDVATRFAEATGTDAKEAIQKLTDAIGKGSAKGLREFGVFIEKGESFDALWQKLIERQQSLEPVADSAANAIAAVSASWSEFIERLGLVVNESPELTSALRGIQETIDNIDLTQFGESLVTIATKLVNLADMVLPKVIKGINDFANGLRVLDALAASNFNFADADELIAHQNAMAQVTKKNRDFVSSMKDLKEITKLATDEYEKFKKGGELSAKVTDQIAGKLENLKGQTFNTEQQQEAYNKSLTFANLAVGDLVDNTPKATRAFGEFGNSAEDAAKKQAQFNKTWKEALANFEQGELQEALQSSLENLDSSGFEKAVTALADQAAAEFMSKWEEGIAKGFIAEADVQSLADKIRQDVIDDNAEHFKQKSEESAQKLADDQKKAYEESVDFWQNIFENAITGETFSFEDTLKRIAVGFGAELAASIDAGFLSGIGSAQDFGGSLAKLAQGWVYDMQYSYESSNPSGFYGPGGDPSGSGEGQAATTGAEANQTLNAIAGYGAATVTTLNSIMSASERDRATGSYEGTGSAVGAGAGAVIGGIYGGPAGAALGSQFGSMAGGLIGGLFGSGPDPETVARGQFAQLIEDQLKAVGAVMFGPDGMIYQMRDLQIDAFNSSGGRAMFEDLFSETSASSQNMFTGLGQALEEILGITEDVGGQMGMILSANLSGNIDNARLLVQALGVDLETVTNALVQTGLTGEASWHEVEVGIQGATAAFGEGLAAVGAYDDAFANLIASGGRGRIAIKSVRDVAIEAMEAGATSLEDLKARMMASGEFSAEEIDAFFQALSQRGIATLDALAQANDRTLGGVVADMESLGVKWGEVGEDIKEVLNLWDQFINGTPDIVEKTVKINVEQTGSTSALNSGSGGGTEEEQLATGGIVLGPTHALIGEAGPEAVLPLSRMGNYFGINGLGSDSSGGSFYINVDARGDQNLEQRLTSMFENMRQRIIYQAVNAAAAVRMHGGNIGNQMQE